MSNTSALSRTTSSLYSALAIGLLACWSATALALTALNVVNEHISITGSVATISLLTFLTSRLVVALRPSGAAPAPDSNATIADLIAYANRGPQPRPVIFFLFCCIWMYYLLITGFLLLGLTVLGGALAYAFYHDEDGAFASKRGNFDHNDHFHNDSPLGKQQTTSPPLNENSTALAIVEFQEKTGFDATTLLRRVPPTAFIGFVVVVWINFLSLGLYVLGHAAKSAVTLLATEKVVVVREKVVVQAHTLTGSPSHDQGLSRKTTTTIQETVILDEKNSL